MEDLSSHFKDHGITTDIAEKICPSHQQSGDLETTTGHSKPLLRYYKVYAVLVSLNKQKHIREFIQNGFSDDDLPIVAGHPVCGARNVDETAFPLDVCNVWRFIDAQWRFCTPYFEMGEDYLTKTYILDEERIILPFASLGTFSQPETTNPYHGFQTSPPEKPTRIEIDPLSHGFHSILDEVSNRLQKEA